MDKIQSLQVQQRMLKIRKDNFPKRTDLPAANEGLSIEAKLSQRNLNHIATKERSTLDKDEVKWNQLKADQSPNIPVRANPDISLRAGNEVASPRRPPTAADLKAFSIENRGKGSMDHKQRVQAKAKEMTYIDMLETEFNKDKPTERANSIAKDFHEQRTKNDTLIQDQLKKQNEKLLEKLKERQVNSFNKSLQKLSDSYRKGQTVKDAKDQGRLASRRIHRYDEHLGRSQFTTLQVTKEHLEPESLAS